MAPSYLEVGAYDNPGAVQIAVPSSACFKTNAICASLNLEAFI